MDFLHSAMNQHVKGKHLSFEERVIIQTRLKDGCSIRALLANWAALLLRSAMKSDGALFLSITASRSATRLIRAKAFIK